MQWGFLLVFSLHGLDALVLVPMARLGVQGIGTYSSYAPSKFQALLSLYTALCSRSIWEKLWFPLDIATKFPPMTFQTLCRKAPENWYCPEWLKSLWFFFFFPFLPFLQMQSREPDRLSKFCNLKVELWFLFQWLSQKQHNGKNPRLEPSWLVLWSWASHLTSGSPGPFICKQGSRIEFLWWSLLVLMTWFLKADFFLFSHQRSEAERGGEGTACLDQSVASQSPRLLPVEVTHLASYQVRDRGMWGWKTLVDSEVEIDQYLWRTYLGPEHDLVTGEQETIIQKKEGIKTHNKKKLISCPQKTHILIVQQSITFLNPDSVLTNECEINGLFNSLLKWWIPPFHQFSECLGA